MLIEEHPEKISWSRHCMTLPTVTWIIQLLNVWHHPILCLIYIEAKHFKNKTEYQKAKADHIRKILACLVKWKE